MKDDLISRKAVRDGMMKYGFVAPDMTVHEFVEDELPSVRAVPLDKLCEWLAGYAEPPLDALTICGNPFEAWKMTLTNWMEEQDADRQ